MFTGLVEDIGKLVATSPEGAGRRLVIETSIDAGGIALGDSVAADGICLTVTGFPSLGRYEVVAGRETVERTTLGSWRSGRRLHLERALRVGDRLGGHWVQGHVDGVGQVERAQRERESLVLWIRGPAELKRYLAEKGSVALDGVSLTVNEVRDVSFRVNIIPHTVEKTRFGALSAGDALNIEIDVLARYVERLLGLDGGSKGRTPPEGLDIERLRANGFL